MLLKPKKTINLPIYLSSLMCYSQVRTVFLLSCNVLCKFETSMVWYLVGKNPRVFLHFPK